jgi:hypothetical protein
LYHAQIGTELDQEAISECLTTGHRIKEGLKIASGNGDSDVTKVGRSCLLGCISRQNELKVTQLIDIRRVWREMFEEDIVMDIGICYV